MFKDYTIDRFVGELASDMPAPGGGGAAALAAATGSALGAMVYSLTVDKKLYLSYDEAARKIVDENLLKLMEMKNEFLQMIDKDAEAFMSLMDAFKLSKSTDEEKKIRKEELQKGYLAALNAPLLLAKKAFEAYEYVLNACKYGNKGVISDAGVAAIMLQAAIEASVINVKVNLAYVDDMNFVSATSAVCDKLVEDGTDKKTEILNEAYKIIEEQ